MTLEWSDNRTEPLPTDSVFHIEEACSLYFSRLLEAKSHSAFQDPNEVLSTTVAVQKQRLDNGIMIIESGLKVVHLGDEGIVDLAALLMFLTNKNTTNSSFTDLDNLIGMEVHLDMVSFTNADESNLLSSGNSEDVGISSTKKYSDSEKTLIIVTSALSFSLFTLSIILIWVAGGWLALRKQVKVLIHREEELTRLTKQNNDEIKEKPTEDSDEESGDADDVTQFTNPSGILGVNPYYGQSSRTPGALDGLGIKMTPARESNEDGSSIFTPMSAQTNYSDTGRAPIGIMSMRKLVPGNGGDQKDRNSLGNFGIKRLEY
jgi:hypothetical protein